MASGWYQNCHDIDKLICVQSIKEIVVRLLHNTELCRVDITNSDCPAARISIRRFPRSSVTRRHSRQ